MSKPCWTMGLIHSSTSNSSSSHPNSNKIGTVNSSRKPVFTFANEENDPYLWHRSTDAENILSDLALSTTSTSSQRDRTSYYNHPKMSNASKMTYIHPRRYRRSIFHKHGMNKGHQRMIVYDEEHSKVPSTSSSTNSIVDGNSDTTSSGNQEHLDSTQQGAGTTFRLPMKGVSGKNSDARNHNSQASTASTSMTAASSSSDEEMNLQRIYDLRTWDMYVRIMMARKKKQPNDVSVSHPITTTTNHRPSIVESNNDDAAFWQSYNHQRLQQQLTYYPSSARADFTTNPNSDNNFIIRPIPLPVSSLVTCGATVPIKDDIDSYCEQEMIFGDIEV